MVGITLPGNVAIKGQCNATERHLRLPEDHGWSRYISVDLLDAQGPGTGHPMGIYGTRGYELIEID